MTLSMCAGFATSVAMAAPPEPLDTEFLDYLAQCEGKDDNWTVVASGKERKKATPPPPAKPSPPIADTKQEATP